MTPRRSGGSQRAGRFRMASAIGLRHPASASCLGRHSRLAGRCPNNSSLFPPLAAVVVVALWPYSAERLFLIEQSRSVCGRSGFAFSRGGNSLSQSLAALPAPSGREPLARPGKFLVALETLATGLTAGAPLSLFYGCTVCLLTFPCGSTTIRNKRSCPL